MFIIILLHIYTQLLDVVVVTTIVWLLLVCQSMCVCMWRIRFSSKIWMLEFKCLYYPLYRPPVNIILHLHSVSQLIQRVHIALNLLLLEEAELHGLVVAACCLRIVYCVFIVIFCNCISSLQLRFMWVSNVIFSEHVSDRSGCFSNLSQTLSCSLKILDERSLKFTTVIPLGKYWQI